MSGKRYSEEFKIEAVKQITERNYPIGQVSKGLGVTTKSLYTRPTGRCSTDSLAIFHIQTL